MVVACRRVSVVVVAVVVAAASAAAVFTDGVVRTTTENKRALRGRESMAVEFVFQILQVYYSTWQKSAAVKKSCTASPNLVLARSCGSPTTEA